MPPHHLSLTIFCLGITPTTCASHNSLSVNERYTSCHSTGECLSFNQVNTVSIQRVTEDNRQEPGVFVSVDHCVHFSI
jgi:hypothetical protein